MPFLHAQQAMGEHRLVGTLNGHSFVWPQSACALNQSCGGVLSLPPQRGRHRLHPLRHPHLFTNGGVTSPDLASDHLTQVQPDTQLQVDVAVCV